jgi:hypothetical protein
MTRKRPRKKRHGIKKMETTEHMNTRTRHRKLRRVRTHETYKHVNKERHECINIDIYLCFIYWELTSIADKYKFVRT